MSFEMVRKDYEERVAAALFEAVVRASLDKDTNTACLLTGEIINACLKVVALLSATSEVTSSPTKTREFTGNCAKRLRGLIASTKEVQAQSGLDFLSLVSPGKRRSKRG